MEEAAAADEAFGPPKLNIAEVSAVAEDVDPPNAKDGAVAAEGASADAVPPKENRDDFPASRGGPPNANAVEDGAATAGFTTADEDSGNPKDAVLLSFPLPLD